MVGNQRLQSILDKVQNADNQEIVVVKDKSWMGLLKNKEEKPYPSEGNVKEINDLFSRHLKKISKPIATKVHEFILCDTNQTYEE